LGKGHHGFLEALKEAVREAEIERFGVVGHIDMLEDSPIEVKTTRQPVEPKNIPPHYLRQLAYYCLLTGRPKGYLIVFHLISGSLQAFEVDYSDCLASYEAEFKDRLGRLQAALETDDLSLLEGSNYDWECQHCGFRRLCEKQQPKKPNLLMFVGAET
jgi:CRISPR/Cas system-associated exonuclease Cas4 (RecB family)